MTGIRYSKTETAIVKEWYPKEGLPGVVARLRAAGFNRSWSSVAQKAYLLKLKSPYCLRNITPSKPPTRWSWPPKLDEPYAEACRLIEGGMKISHACEKAGIIRTDFYKIRKIKAMK